MFTDDLENKVDVSDIILHSQNQTMVDNALKEIVYSTMTSPPSDADRTELQQLTSPTPRGIIQHYAQSYDIVFDCFDDVENRSERTQQYLVMFSYII